MGTYNSSLGTTSQKPYSISKGYPVDSRSYYYDDLQFKWRAYQSTAEVLTYLDTPVSRSGQFVIIVNQGGTLTGTTFTGGTYKAYWFKDGVADSNLVSYMPSFTINNVAPDANNNFTINTSGSNGLPYVLPVANNILGGVKITPTSGMTIDPATGELTLKPYTFTPKIVPFAKPDGSLGEDVTALTFDDTNLIAGKESPLAYTGVALNNNKGGIYASNEGMLLKLGTLNGTDTDIAKSIVFTNGLLEYLKIFTSGLAAQTNTYVNTAMFNANVVPRADKIYALGSETLRWLGMYADTVYATTVNTDTLNSTTVNTTDLYADTITTNDLTAISITTTNLTATNANITSLTAGDITTNTLTATSIDTTNLTAENANITNLTAENASITNLTAENATITNLTATNIDATTINTETLNSTTINNSGDINTENLNATTVTTTNLVADNITTNILNATTANITNLTADTIDATTINATTVNTQNLVADNITLNGDDLTTIVQNISYSPYGDRNQIQYVSTDGTKDYYTDEILSVGQYITTDDELAAAKGTFIGFNTIFQTWKRFSHGTANLETAPTSPYGLPDIPIETNSWVYDIDSDIIKSTENSDSFIGFVSPTKYSRYEHSVTLNAQDGSESFNDNDFIIIVMAYVEDPTDLVTNNAHGLNSSTYKVDTTSTSIPNQHTLSLVRGRTAQKPYLIDGTIRYCVVYNLGKPDQKIIANGESMVWNTENTYNSGKTCDVKVIRQGDVFKCYTTDWNDAPNGKGALGNELVVDMSLHPELAKFRGSASYGYGACSQKDSYFLNVKFSPSVNTIYDVRNGDVWVADAHGVYTIDTTRSFYTEYGVRREYYNPVTTKLIYVKGDKTFNIINTPTDGPVNAVTDITKPDPALQTLRVFKGPDYFDINFDSATSSGGSGEGGGRFGAEDNLAAANRKFILNDYHLDIKSRDVAGSSAISHYSQDGGGFDIQVYDDVSKFTDLYITASNAQLYSSDTVNDVNLISQFHVTPSGISYNIQQGLFGGTVNLVIKPSEVITAPISVNGQFADATGNITISGGGSTPNLQAVTDVNAITTNPIHIETSNGGLSIYSGDGSTGGRAVIASGGFGGYVMLSNTNHWSGLIISDLLTNHQSYSLPNKSGTIALLGDVSQSIFGVSDSEAQGNRTFDLADHRMFIDNSTSFTITSKKQSDPNVFVRFDLGKNGGNVGAGPVGTIYWNNITNQKSSLVSVGGDGENLLLQSVGPTTSSSVTLYDYAAIMRGYNNSTNADSTVSTSYNMVDIRSSGLTRIQNLPTFSDNASAKAVVGMVDIVYKTPTGDLKITY